MRFSSLHDNPAHVRIIGSLTDNLSKILKIAPRSHVYFTARATGTRYFRTGSAEWHKLPVTATIFRRNRNDANRIPFRSMTPPNRQCFRLPLKGRVCGAIDRFNRANSIRIQ